jgi:hypothetical protein
MPTLAWGFHNEDAPRHRRFGHVSAVAVRATDFKETGGQSSSHTQGTGLTCLLYSYPGGSKQEMLVTDPSENSVGRDALTGKEESSATNASYALEGQGDISEGHVHTRAPVYSRLFSAGCPT